MNIVQNQIDRFIARYASIIHRSNIPLIGGLGVNEEIAKPIDSFKLSSSKFSNEERVVNVYQYQPPQYPLNYRLEEMVPNRIVLDLNKNDSGLFQYIVGGIVSKNKLSYSSLQSHHTPSLGNEAINEPKLITNGNFWGEDTPFFYLYGQKWSDAFLLLDQDSNSREAIKQFSEGYEKEKRKGQKEEERNASGKSAK